MSDEKEQFENMISKSVDNDYQHCAGYLITHTMISNMMNKYKDTHTMLEKKISKVEVESREGDKEILEEIKKLNLKLDINKDDGNKRASKNKDELSEFKTIVENRLTSQEVTTTSIYNLIKWLFGLIGTAFLGFIIEKLLSFIGG